ncbi:DEAD/DEAH box helicase family protein [Streptomyces mobaraensis]|uniref:DEAD/DEAH box helicase family protein n=1 Tax=Streptomyces mobaraensis TaxID=35621 RepID=UPI001CCE1D47|nr:DEAD/DEAH box helicase family protein [Streptomyces mobaraensis]UBI40903.1 DEAD/DEAH box helicase family protein [Streptomyces mobaraensis]
MDPKGFGGNGEGNWYAGERTVPASGGSRRRHPPRPTDTRQWAHAGRGLRTQVIAATGSGKTLIAAEATRKLGARRVLVLVPTLDLLTQTAAVWREDGRAGA